MQKDQTLVQQIKSNKYKLSIKDFFIKQPNSLKFKSKS
jgi:hypothetical protein